VFSGRRRESFTRGGGRRHSRAEEVVRGRSVVGGEEVVGVGLGRWSAWGKMACRRPRLQGPRPDLALSSPSRGGAGGSGTAPPALFPSSRSMAFLRHWPVSVMCVEEGLVDWAIALLAIGCEWMVDEKARVTLCRVNVGALDLSPPQGPCFLVPWPNASLPPCPHRLLRSPLSLSVSSDASKKE
jgi:hypothetical protein